MDQKAVTPNNCNGASPQGKKIYVSPEIIYTAALEAMAGLCGDYKTDLIVCTVVNPSQPS